jgi:hypothetical protein
VQEGRRQKALELEAEGRREGRRQKALELEAEGILLVQ